MCVCVCLQSLSHDPITASWSWLLSHLSCQLQREKESKPVIASSHQNLLSERERGEGGSGEETKESMLCLDFISIEEEVHNGGLYILVSEKQSINRARPTLAEHCGAFE